MMVTKKIIQFFNALLLAVIAFVLIINVYVIGIRTFTDNPQPTVFGWSWSVVISGSMEPNISVNDLVIAHRQGSYEEKDIIVFKKADTAVVHRIIEKNQDEYITKGDNNNTPDQNPVKPEMVVGKVVATVPQVGLVIEYLRTPLGIVWLILIGIVLTFFQLNPEKSET